MRLPFSPIHLFIILVFALWIMFSIQMELITLTFAKLGLSPQSALTLMLVSLAGSLINLPLFSLHGCQNPPQTEEEHKGFLRPPELPFDGTTLVAVNVGGCLVPLFFSMHLLQQSKLSPFTVLIAVCIVAAVSYKLSRPIPGIGIGMPILVAPLTAAIVSIAIGEEHRATLAYISGSLGVLIGADIFRFKNIREMGTPLASIGGAGTFDGIFMSGLVAVLLT